MGVSIWTSETLRHAAAVTAARPLMIAAAAVLAIINFTERIVVLPDVLVVRVDLESLIIGCASLVELAHLLVADPEIVPRLRVRRIEFRGLLPPENGLSPEPLVRDVDAERHLRFRVRAPVGIERHRDGQQGRHEKCAPHNPHQDSLTIARSPHEDDPFGTLASPGLQGDSARLLPGRPRRILRASIRPARFSPPLSGTRRARWAAEMCAGVDRVAAPPVDPRMLETAVAMAELRPPGD